MLQIIVVSIQIIQNTGCIQLIQGNLAYNFRNFLQRACAARKCNKRIPKGNHFRLPFGHILCNNQFCQPIVLEACIHEKLRFYACYFAAGFKDSLCKLTHQPCFRAAIYQCIAAFTNPMPQCLHCLTQTVVIAFICSKVYSNIHSYSPSSSKKVTQKRTNRFFGQSF